MQSTSFLVAGGVGIVANYALFSQYTPVSMDLMLKELATVVQPLAGLKVVLPALFGFMGGSLLLLIWRYLSTRAVRFLLDYNGWFLHPKKPINKVWYLVMKLLLGTKNRGLGRYQDYLPSLPVPPLDKTCKKYLESVKPLLTAEEYETTKAAVKEFLEQDGTKLQWLLTFRSWKNRNWIADWWREFIYLRQRTPICFNSNYYASDQHKIPTHSQLDRAAHAVYSHALFVANMVAGEVDNAMGHAMAPFCSNSYGNLTSTMRVPGEEKDRIKNYSKEKPTHGLVYRQGRYYVIEVLSPDTLKPHSPLTIRSQLEKIMAIAGDTRDETGVQNMTALPRAKWARLYQTLMKNPVNRRSLNMMGSAIGLVCLETEDPPCDDMSGHARLYFHGDGYSRWFDKTVQLVVAPSGHMGANAEHTALDATVCGQLWEFMLTEERYDANGRCMEVYPGEQPVDTPTPAPLKWEVDDLSGELAEAATHLANMIKDSDMIVSTSSYGKSVPKKCKLSPDGWFQMAIQLAYYRLHHKIVLTYESATTRLYYDGRTETIRPVSEHSVAFVKAMDDPAASKDDIKEHLKKAIKYQCDYKMEAMRGFGVDRHLFGLYVMAKGLKLDPMPKMFTDKAFNFSFLLSTSQTPVKATNRWNLETSASTGGFGTVCDEGYGVSYIVVGEDEVNFCVESKRSCPDTSTEKFCKAVCVAFDDMKNLFDL